MPRGRRVSPPPMTWDAVARLAVTVVPCASAFRSRWRLFVCLFVRFAPSAARMHCARTQSGLPTHTPLQRTRSQDEHQRDGAARRQRAAAANLRAEGRRSGARLRGATLRKRSPRRHRPLWRGRVPSRTHAAVCRWASIVTNVRLTLRWVQADPTDFILYVPDCTDAKKLRAKVSPPIFRQRRMPRAPQQRGVAWRSQ